MTTHGSATLREETPHEIETTNTLDNDSESTVEKIEALAEIICGAGDESTAALFVLMGTLQNSPGTGSAGTLGEALCLYTLR